MPGLLRLTMEGQSMLSSRVQQLILTQKPGACVPDGISHHHLRLVFADALVSITDMKSITLQGTQADALREYLATRISAAQPSNMGLQAQKKLEQSQVRPLSLSFH
jgi:hypothetical protein